MVFPIVGGNQATGDFITNSLRFNDGDSPSLQFTPSSAGNEKTWTVSFWVKRGVVTTSSAQMIFCSDTNYDEYVFCRFCGTENTGKEDELQVLLTEPNGRQSNVTTSRKFRDPSAWYHIVVRCDTTQSTSTNRLRVYVNGSQETSFRDNSQLNQNDDNINWNSNVPQAIGHQKQASSVERHLDGYLAEFYNIDGTSLGPDSFGETNDNGVWIPKDAKNDLTFGTNGYYLQFKQTGTSANSSGIGADTSGNDHHWTPANLAAIDVTTDTPQNNFATWNPLDPNRDNDLSEGNTQYVSPTSAREQIRSTFGLTSGKWYWETKPTTANGGLSVGVLKENASMTLDDSLGKDAYGWSYDSDGSSRHSNSSTSSGFDTYTSNDIIGVALDLDNHEIFFYKNGTAQNSGNKAFDLDTGETYFAACGSNSNGSTETFQVNFGNAPFSISSSNSDANGHGSFEYAVPSGYFALCTKNLAEYG
jgi:hypothetical protein